MIDIIWNISLICPWDCKFCCTDAVSVRNKAGSIEIKEDNLKVVTYCKKQNESIYDTAIRDRQSKGLEATFEEKIRALNNLPDKNVEIDFAGGDPLVCTENLEVIKQAREKYGKENISVTSTGIGLKMVSDDYINENIGTIDITYDEPEKIWLERPKSYNSSNVLAASKVKKFHDTKIRAQIPIHHGNSEIPSIEKIFKELHENHIDEILLMRVFHTGRGLNEGKQKKFDYEKIYKTYLKLQNKYGYPKVKLQCALKGNLVKQESNPCDLMQGSFGMNSKCQLLVSAWANGFNGEVLDDAFYLGDLKVEKFSEIEKTKKFITYKKMLDNNFGHCKIFSYQNKNENSQYKGLFEKIDPLYENIKIERLG